MVTDQQVRRLFRLMNTEKTQEMAALKAGMDVKTARKYVRAKALPSELRQTDIGGRTRMSSPMFGPRFRSNSGPIRVLKRRRSLRLCNGNSRNGLLTANYVLCSARSNTGGRPKGRQRKCILSRNIMPAMSARRISPTSPNSQSQSADRAFHTCSITSY